MIVQPIRELSKLYEMQKLLYEEKKYRQLLLVQLMYNSNLRISDALLIKWKDVMLPDQQIVEKFYISEKKTHKMKMIPITDELGKALLTTYERLNKPALSTFIFASQSKRVARKHGIPWTRIYVTRFIKIYAKRVGITENVGSHTMRKTFAYHLWRAGTDIYLIMKILNHSSPVITEKYVGITDDKMAEGYHKASELNKACNEFFQEEH
jgi:site-specific recombinase XerD